MKRKLLLRTVRNVVLRNRPYFAHLALTHKCNLHCSFCHIPEERVPELDTAGMKRIIEKLDRMGIAYLSISGGGEPLLRRDFAEILNYAADCKSSSNTSKRTRLEESRVMEARKINAGIVMKVYNARSIATTFPHIHPQRNERIRCSETIQRLLSKIQKIFRPSALRSLTHFGRLAVLSGGVRRECRIRSSPQLCG